MILYYLTKREANIITEIIFIDDNSIILSSYRIFNEQFLESKNPASYFLDSVQAYHYLEENKHNKIVISDLDMPIISGKEIYDLLCSQNIKCVFLLVSGSVNFANFESGNNGKVRLFKLTKPFSLIKLEKIISESIQYLKGDDSIQQDNFVCVQQI